MVTCSVRQISSYLGIDSQDLKGINHTAVDSRLCTEQTLYIALRGEKEDGHDYLKQAAENGAIAAIVSKDYRKDSYGLTLLFVEDPLTALQLIAKKVLSEIKPLVIGVSGSVGKTTVKEFIATLLEGSYTIYKTPDSYNGQIGLPLTILNGDPYASVWVLEMGMSYKDEMDKLVDIAPCHIGVVTRVAPAHYGHFNSVEEIAKEKAKLLDSPCLQKGFIHHMNQRFLSFKKKECNFFYELPLQLEFDLPFSERHLMENFFIAALVAKQLGVSDEKIQKRALFLKSANHRFEKHILPSGALIIDDSYNSNPIALKTVLQIVSKFKKKGKVIGVLGEMKELGSLSILAHQELGMIASTTLDTLICYGAETRPLYEMFKKSDKPASHHLDKQSLIKDLLSILEEGDVALVKGSNSNRLWEVVDLLTKAVD